jgi:hypothetical protein
MSDVDVARNTGIKRTTFIRYRKKFNIKRWRCHSNESWIFCTLPSTNHNLW